MKKAIVFGGAFNPPTIAHIDLAKHVLDTLHYDFVIFVPSKSVYIQNEQKKDFVFSQEERFAMLQAIAKENPWMIVSDYELQASSQPRTYTTLCYLKTQGYDCKWLMGSDKLEELSSVWKYVDELMREFGIVCVERNGDDVQKMVDSNPFLSKYQSCIQIVKSIEKYQNVSSTLVRKCLQQGDQSIAQWIPAQIRKMLIK